MKTNKIFILTILINFISITLWAKDSNSKKDKFFLLSNNMVDIEASDINKEINEQNIEQNQDKKEENIQSDQDISNKEPKEKEVTQEQIKESPKKLTLDECIQQLQSMDVNIQKLALLSCAKEYQKEEKLHDVLLELVKNSQDLQIQLSSVLLLSNQKTDKISSGLLEILKSEEIKKNNVLTYAISLVLYSSLNDNYKQQTKEIFTELTNTNDEILKNLTENLLKKL